MQRILSWVAFVGGEIILFAAFGIWGGNLPTDIRVLDTVISMFVLALFFVDLLIPWVDWSGGSQKRLGSLGLRWTFTWLYAVAAVVVMVLCQAVFAAEFNVQLLVHAVLLVGVVLGFSASSGASARIGEVHAREEDLLSGPREMQRIVGRLRDQASETANLPKEIRARIVQLAEEVRYVAPCASAEAADAEKQFADAIRTVGAALPSFDMNREKIVAALARAERLCSQRKALHNY